MQSDEPLLTPVETAAFLNIQPATLARWRWCGRGPVFSKIGGAVRYAPSELRAWLEAQRRTSTSDGGAGKQ